MCIGTSLLLVQSSYSDSPAALRASLGLGKNCTDWTLPSRMLHSCPFRFSIFAATALGPHAILVDGDDLVAAFEELLGLDDRRFKCREPVLQTADIARAPDECRRWAIARESSIRSSGTRPETSHPNRRD